MNRRELLKLGGILAVSAGLPALTNAAPTPMAGGIFYTKGKPGRWAGREATHVPILSTTQTQNGIVLNVVNNSHPMEAYQHYIVKHVILDADFNFGAEKLFNPSVDKQASSSFNLGNYKGVVHVLSVCNLHDTWLTAIQI
ncbi:MAG: hypothetical protein HQL46_01075 [Gammaproteobacteria bacterium]|nr:hypothetical protein [Gammaproteobacteria bacterium]